MEEEAKKEELNTQELDPSSPGGGGRDTIVLIRCCGTALVGGKVRGCNFRT